MCGYVRDKCSLECGEVLQRNELKLHQEENCPEREVRCEHCFTEFKFRDMHSHHKECPKMKVTCELCDEMMCREDVTQHLEQDCVMMGTCELGCGMRMTRDELKIHIINICEHREVSCENCWEELKSYDMSDHLEMCPKMKVSCELKCGVVMCRKDMTQHVEQDCLEKEIECPFAKYNCEAISIKRKHLSQHLEENRTEHLELKLTAMELKLNEMEDTVFKQCEGSNEIKQHVDESKQHRDESKQLDESKQTLMKEMRGFWTGGV